MSAWKSIGLTKLRKNGRHNSRPVNVSRDFWIASEMWNVWNLVVFSMRVTSFFVWFNMHCSWVPEQWIINKGEKYFFVGILKEIALIWNLWHNFLSGWFIWRCIVLVCHHWNLHFHLESHVLYKSNHHFEGQERKERVEGGAVAMTLRRR